MSDSLDADAIVQKALERESLALCAFSEASRGDLTLAEAVGEVLQLQSADEHASAWHT